jgi:hypothetical protein
MGIACTEVKQELANANEEHLPKRVEHRAEARTAFPRSEARLNGISGKGIEWRRVEHAPI